MLLFIIYSRGSYRRVWGEIIRKSERICGERRKERKKERWKDRESLRESQRVTEKIGGKLSVSNTERGR